MSACRGAIGGSREGDPDSLLPDGSPVYWRVGVLAIDEESKLVQCARCGGWLNTISGSHLTTQHGLTVVQYREIYGLGLRTVLESPDRRVSAEPARSNAWNGSLSCGGCWGSMPMSPTAASSWKATGAPRCTAIRRSNQRPERRRQYASVASGERSFATGGPIAHR